MIVRLLLSCGLLLAGAVAAPAANFVVTSSATGAFDALPGDGVCEATIGAGDCSVVAAVQETNALVGQDVIALPAGSFPSDPFLNVTDSVIISGAGAASTTIRGNGTNTVLTFDGPDVTLAGVTITGGRGINVGGGITNYGGHLTLVDTVVSGNRTTNVGGGVYNHGGRLTMVGCTVSGNVAGNVGGGIHNEGAAELVNCTVSGNFAGNTSGGIGNEGTISLDNCTVANNLCGNTGAGVDNQFDSAGAFTIRNTIISGNRAAGQPNDCIGTLTSQGYNLLQDSFCTVAGSGSASDLHHVDPLLGPLADNGGPTPTRALLDGSPAINGGNPVPTHCAAVDQRGIARPQGVRCDIGAFELARCGDGVLDAEEECDDGSNVDGDGCDSNCTVTRCGNGVTTAGEECDDGNTADGDCCTSSCELVPTDEIVPPAPAGADLQLSAGPKGKVVWKWRGAEALNAFGNPTAGSSYTLCVIDTTGATPSLITSVPAPAGASWKATASGFKYLNRTPAAGGARKALLRAGSRAQIAVEGRKPRVRSGRLPLVTPVRVVLVRSDGTTVWGAVFDGAKRNRVDGFKGRSR